MTVTSIRTDYLNGYLGRTDGATKPWTDAMCNDAIEQAILELWPHLGVFASGTVATNGNSPIYAIPNGITRVSRIVAERTDGGEMSQIDAVTSWRYHSPTQVVISPKFSTDASVALRFYGWAAHASTGADLSSQEEPLVAMKAAALAWGQALGLLGNFEDQLALDSGRVVTHQDAVGLSAYWQRRYEDQLRSLPGRVGYAPRAASR